MDWETTNPLVTPRDGESQRQACLADGGFCHERDQEMIVEIPRFGSMLPLH